MSTALPVPTPQVNPETQPYWDAAKEGRLLIKRCTACSTVIWYPRAICPECWSQDTEWCDASGHGTVYSYTINQRGQGPYATCGPYVLAYVELDEGPRILTNIIAGDIEAIEIGDPVEVVFHPTDDTETALPRFRLK